MDAANYALARYLAARGEVHLVAHRAWADLASLPAITLHRVWRPFDWNVVGRAAGEHLGGVEEAGHGQVELDVLLALVVPEPAVNAG